MSARHSPYGGTSCWKACGRPKWTLSRARLNVREALAYTSWSTVFCHPSDSSSHKATMTVDAVLCSFTHRGPNDQIVISHPFPVWMVSRVANLAQVLGQM